MTARKHDVESQGANPRDFARPHHPYWKRAHRDWRLWIVAVLMLALMGVYLMTMDLSLRPAKRTTQATPQAILP